MYLGREPSFAVTISERELPLSLRPEEVAGLLAGLPYLFLNSQNAISSPDTEKADTTMRTETMLTATTAVLPPAVLSGRPTHTPVLLHSARPEHSSPLPPTGHGV